MICLLCLLFDALCLSTSSSAAIEGQGVISDSLGQDAAVTSSGSQMIPDAADEDEDDGVLVEHPPESEVPRLDHDANTGVTAVADDCVFPQVESRDLKFFQVGEKVYVAEHPICSDLRGTIKRFYTFRGQQMALVSVSRFNRTVDIPVLKTSLCKTNDGEVSTASWNDEIIVEIVKHESQEAEEEEFTEWDLVDWPASADRSRLRNVAPASLSKRSAEFASLVRRWWEHELRQMSRERGKNAARNNDETLLLK